MVIPLKRWTVSELTRYIRLLFDGDYRLQDLEVEGEISDFRIPGSGHAYFTLKDAEAQLRCVMWRDALERQSQRYLPQHGDRVIARGYVGVYEAGGQYQLYCRELRPAGVGDLHAQFEELKAKLQAEGLFDPARKRPIPPQPRVIGLVTSPSTAAFQDVLNILSRRYPLARLVLSPTLVQGDAAPPQIIAALEALNARPDVDVILIVRGGGSLEDLWCFNDERVARAVAASRIPVISGVGHEIDFTLTDFAADLRAPTPSAAAELATSVTVDDLRSSVRTCATRLTHAFSAELAARRRALQSATYTFRRFSPRAWVDNLRQRLDSLISRMRTAAGHALALRQASLMGARRALMAFNPEETLARGYAIVHGPDGRVLRDAATVSPGDALHIRLHRGRLQASVQQVEREHGRESIVV